MLLYLEDITRSMGESQGGYAQDKKARQKEALTCGHLSIDLKITFTFFLGFFDIVWECVLTFYFHTFC
jgi:hypothetical protein